MELQHRDLIRFIMRTFYEIPKSLIIEYIYYYDRISHQDLVERLCLDSKVVRAYIQEFKRDQFIIEDHRLESNDGTTGRRNQDQYYYKLDIPLFIDVVNYRLLNMQTYVTNLERQQTYKQTNYQCEQCSKDYTELDFGRLYDFTKNALICSICDDGLVHEVIEAKETTTTSRQTVTMSLFNEQMKTLFQILKQIEEAQQNEQRLKNSSDSDPFQQNGNSSSLSSNHIKKENMSMPAHRSHASNVFDCTSTINHGIQVVIEKDDDDHDSQMDIDETSHTDSSAARGPGKPGKKSIKSVQSAAEVASRPVPVKMKSSSKKVPYEPKPLPQWFVRSTIYNDHEEEQRLNSLSSNPSANSSSLSRQLSNQKLIKSTTIDDIKQMLLIYESRTKKNLTLTTMEDSLSPPTPVQMSKTTDSQ